MSLKLPSTVTDTKFLWMPPDRNVVDDDEEWEKCGKWILYVPNNDLSLADKIWTDLQALLNNGCLLLLKAATAAFKESRVILCYTRPGQEEARKAAEAIREVVHYEYIMYHKSNKVTNEGRARRFGDRSVAQYMHTFLGHFYVRDAIPRWKLVDTRNEFSISERNHEASEAENIPLELQRLPSSGKVVDFNRSSEIARGIASEGSFRLNCNLQKGEDGLIEADCVWSAVESLYDAGDFIGIRSCPCPQEERIGFINCYVTDYSDLQVLVNIAKRIFRTTRFPSIIFFNLKTDVKKFDVKYFIKYHFTHGEVYEDSGNDIRKFISSFEI